jgi:hypothetical protein
MRCTPAHDGSLLTDHHSPNRERAKRLRGDVSYPTCLATKKRRVLWASVVFAAVLGVPLGLLPDHGPADTVLSIVITLGTGILVLAWCHYDSRQLGRRIGPGFRWLVVILGFLALFIYLLRTRGARKGGLAVGVAALFIGALILLGAFVDAMFGGLVG